MAIKITFKILTTTIAIRATSVFDNFKFYTVTKKF